MKGEVSSEIETFVTGSGKRDIFAHTIIFSISVVVRDTLFIKKNFFGIAVSTTLWLHSRQIFEELNAFLTGRVTSARKKELAGNKTA